jgi:hypothetical protein
MLSQIFLMLRMAIYVGAFPVSAWLGGTFDAETGLITFNVYSLLDVGQAFVAAGLAFVSGRVAKARGGAT